MEDLFENDDYVDDFMIDDLNPNDDLDLEKLVELFDVNTRDDLYIAKLETSVVLKIALNVYHSILCESAKHHFFDAEEMLNIDEPEKMKTKIEELSYALIKTIKSFDIVRELPNLNVEEQLRDMERTAELFSKAIPFFRDVNTTCALVRSAFDMSTSESVSAMSKINKKLIKNLKVLDESSLIDESKLEENSTIKKSIELLSAFTEKLKEYDATEEKEFESFLSEFRKIETPKEEKIDYAKKANDLYVEFCEDWLRDLEKQVPFSTQDQYKALLAKVEKLKKTFNLPLQKGAKEGHAKEACKQINDLMDKATKISSESYTIGMYR